MSTPNDTAHPANPGTAGTRPGPAPTTTVPATGHAWERARAARQAITAETRRLPAVDHNGRPLNDA